MGRFLATNGALVVLGGLFLVCLAAALASRCLSCLGRLARHLVATNRGNFSRKIQVNGTT